MIRRLPTNAEIADVLERVADLLEAEGAAASGERASGERAAEARAWRVRAWRGGAATLRTLEKPVVAILAESGAKGLVALPAIGKSLSAAIQEYAEKGTLDLLERLEGELTPRALFTTLPGIGEDLARRIHEALGVTTLEDLEAATHDGRLERVPGFGVHRVHAIRDALDAILTRAGHRRVRRFEAPASETPKAEMPETETPETGPSVRALLAVDEAYRQGAEAKSLDRVAPRRFNPEHQAWMPVLRVEEEGWHFVATFSNTARAHELHTTHDWVVIRAGRGDREQLYTVVTERRGALTGRRVIRGREAECATYYAEERARPPHPDT